ncbi:hypothetical protein HK414_13385 [Ramlibacter terrae]|uniref:Uncharacterized protein n=1 Tax=Ramlibacter terrae TaxID=2732511 RepID=A0ABX6P2V2_9BURK|nr:hypothetical protein HK414_13385 [Ramlibacter terrae]
MSYRTPSTKQIAAPASEQAWDDADVVLEGTAADGSPLRITRAEARVPANPVRRWLAMKGEVGDRRLECVRDFVSADGYLFTVAERTRDRTRRLMRT